MVCCVFFVVFGGSCWFLVFFVDLGGFFLVLGNVLVVLGGSLWFLVVLIVSLLFLVIFVVICRYW